MTTRDDELLDVLAASIGPAPDAEPSWAEISHLHRVIDSAAYGPGRAARTPLWRVRRPLTAALAGFLVLGGASAAAAVSGAVMPQPVRVAARAVGLPVDSPGLAGARAALGRLRDDLRDKPRDVNAIRTDAQAVRDRLANLSADDRSHVEDEAAFLLAAADAALAPPATALGAPPPPTAGNPVTGAPPVAPPGNPAPSGDDHGGRSSPSAQPQQPATGADDGHSADNSGSSASPTGSDASGPGPSGSSGDGGHTATTLATGTSGHDGGSGSDGGSSGPDGGGSQDGGSGSTDGGGHSGPG